MSERESFIGPKTQRNILIVIILLLLFGFGYYNIKISNLEKNLNISRQNEYALADSVRVIKKKNGNLEFSRGVYVTKAKNLNKLSKRLAEDLKETDGKVHRLENYIAKMGNQRPDGTKDTIKIQSKVRVYANGDYGLDWGDTTYFDESKNNYRKIVGVSDFRLIKLDSTKYKVKPLLTKISDFEIGFKLKTGLRTNDDGQVEIFAESDYPNFQITEMEGAIINPQKDPVLKKFTRKKKFTAGPYIGFGVDRNLQLTPQIGIGVTWNLVSF